MATGAQLLIVVGAETEGAERKLNTMGGTVNRLAGFMGNALSTALGFAVAQPVMNAVGDALDFVKSSAIDFNSQLQQASIGFTTMLGSGKKAQSFLDQLQQFAASTPFDFQQLIPAAQRMLAFGFRAKDVIPDLRAIGDAVAALGGNAETVDRVTTALGQMKAKGKVSADEMLQLTEAGIPAWDLLAKSMGKSTAQVMQLSQQGLIPADQAIKAITDGMETRFGGMMDKQSSSFQGAMSNIHDSLQSVIATGFRPFFDKLTDGANKIAQFLQTEQFKQFAANVGDALGKLAGHIPDLLSLLGNLKDFIVNVRDHMERWWPIVAIGAGILGGALVAAFVAVGVAAWGAASGVIAATWPFLAIGAAVAALVGGLIWAYNNWGWFKNAVDGARVAIGNLLGWLGPKLGDALGFLGTHLGELMGHLGEFKDWLGPRLGEAFGFIGEKIGGFLGLLGNLRDAFMRGVETVRGWLNTLSNSEPVKNIRQEIGKLGNWIQAQLLPFVRDLATWFAEHLLPAARGAGDTVKTKLHPPLSAVGSFISGTLIPVLGKVGGFIKDQLEGRLRTAGAFITGTVLPTLGRLKDWLGEQIGKAFKTFGDNLHRATDFIGDMIGKAKDLINWLGQLKDKLGSIKDAAGAGIGGVLGHIPGFAAGTMDAPGGPAWVGEGREPEVVFGPHLIDLARGSAVVPVSKLASRSGGGSGGGGGGVSYNFAAGAIVIHSKASSGAELMRELEREVDFLEKGYGK